eukprot:Skav208970  [mRNA]  locus=scaffold1694:1987:2844:- [translate_table: standard]
MCLMCSCKARGFWTCTVCAAQKPKECFQTWMLKHTSSFKGDPICDDCSRRPLARRIVRKALGRVAATQARVVAEKRARVVASVREEIAARKRKREENCSAPQPSARPKDQGREDNIETLQHSASYVDTAQDSAIQKKTRPLEKNRFQYVCPSCGKTVTSTVYTGQVDHRRRCGNRFPVRDGRVVAKSYVYVCPFCQGRVNSNTKTGQINHRSVCNNQFYVKDGQVSKETRQYAHPCPVCRAIVWSSQATGRIQSNHNMPDGKPCKRKEWNVEEKTKLCKSAKCKD